MPLLLLFLPTVVIPPSKRRPFVSVVVCAKNEVSYILSCLEALVGQDYPADMFELIVVDDGSTDGTFSILDSFREMNNFRLLKLRGNTSKKAGALNYGLASIDFNKTERILFTDADCIVSPDWICQMVSGLEMYDVVGGQTVVEDSAVLLSKMQRIEFYGAFSQVAMAQFYLKLAPALMGNNLGVDASYFMNGLRFQEGSWVEDAALVAELRLLSASVHFSSGARVITFAEESLEAVVAQRRRWFQGVRYVSPPLRIFLGFQLIFLPLLYAGLSYCFLLTSVVLVVRFFLMFLSFRKMRLNVSILEIVCYDGYQLLLRFRFLMSSLFSRGIYWVK